MLDTWISLRIVTNHDSTWYDHVYFFSSQALVDMIKTDNMYISRKATLLIGEILQLSTRLLPMSIGTQVQVRDSVSVDLFHDVRKWSD